MGVLVSNFLIRCKEVLYWDVVFALDLYVLLGVLVFLDQVLVVA